MSKVSVYYNSACPVCNAGIGAQRRRMQSCNVDVEWIDIHRNPERLTGDRREQGVRSRATARGRRCGSDARRRGGVRRALEPDASAKNPGDADTDARNQSGRGLGVQRVCSWVVQVEQMAWAMVAGQALPSRRLDSLRSHSALRQGSPLRRLWPTAGGKKNLAGLRQPIAVLAVVRAQRTIDEAQLPQRRQYLLDVS